MNWESFRPGKATNDFFFVLWSLFLATWPGVITNWISDLSSRLLKIETSAGAWSVIAAAITTIIMYWILRRRTDPGGPYNAPGQSDRNSKYYLMQGGMFSLGAALNQACQGVFSGPFSDAKILPMVMTLIPALEGALGAQFVYIKNNLALAYLDAAIKELVLYNPRVNERMIIEHAKGLGKRDNIDPFASLEKQEISEFVRSRMVHLATTGELNMYVSQNQRIAIDSFHDPHQWRIEKKEIEPIRPVVTPSPSPIYTETEQQRKAQEGEKLQRDAWQRLRTNFDDEDALYVLLREAYHTTHGLTDRIRADIANEMNHVLLSSQFPEHRELTFSEQDVIHKLGSILGH